LSELKTFYPRKLLTLEALRLKDTDNEVFEAISNLESPLKLALKLVDSIFTNDGEQLKKYSENLDETKKIAFGLENAETLFFKFSDKLAAFSLYQFAFQQYVQSSFRARQGKALEKILKKILTVKEMRIEPQIASSKDDKIKTLKEVINSKERYIKSIIERHDIDILAKTEDKVIIFQMRSRDDTGGATAKSSLAELLKELYTKELSKEILYVVYIWVKPKTEKPQQKVTLINKLLSMIDLDNAEEIKKVLKEGKIATIKDNLKICVVYGAEDLIKTLWSEMGIKIDEKYKELMDKYSKYLELLSTWDDLWLSYAIATLELENLIKYGKTNVSVITKLLSEFGFEEKLKSEECIMKYEQYSAEISKEISPCIREDDDLIPFNAVGDKMNYIRDLILLKIVHEHLEEIKTTVRKKNRKITSHNTKKNVDITKFLK
jgi:hypothetical protein